MFEKGVVGRCRIVVVPDIVSLGVGKGNFLLHSAPLAPGDDTLNHREPLGRPRFQVSFRLALRVLNKERPRGVSQPEEGFVIAIDEVTPCGRDFDGAWNGCQPVALEMKGYSVDPHRLLGLEINPRGTELQSG